MPPKWRVLLSLRSARASAMRARRAHESQEVAQRSSLTQASQSQEERANCLAGKAAYRNAAATEKSRAIERLDRRRARQSRDAAATASARAAETPLRRSVRNATNAATTARSRTAETYDRRRTRQSRDAAATARNSEGPQTRANRLLRAATNMAAVRLSQTPIRLDGDIQRLAVAHNITYPSSSFWSFLSFNYDSGINLTTRDDINVGSMTFVCQLCNARKWAGEPAGLCCSYGKVRLPPLHEPPTPLRGLIAGFYLDSNHFLKTIRQYNSSFQMTSFGAQVVRKKGWMHTFKVQGQVYHSIGSLLPEETSTPKFLQLYFIADYNLPGETRIGISPQSGRVPRRDVILLFQAMLHEVNSYILSFKYVLQNSFFPFFIIVIDADKWPHDEHERL
ncbi:unnamed protein product [Acanthosepion pharaonis]|uniref:Uncharacterized protein n=1 Tax=Acanthosepion pharaonis TaxID=158019 RepID=A0A812CDD9_ACAPH|nr:unnamed protein product [Sepia pharaonis]